jgi:DNA polymerase
MERASRKTSTPSRGEAEHSDLLAEPLPWPDKNTVNECRRCPLWERATQGVAGEGSRQAALLFVGEQPGDEEDLIGRPFVGPAGRLLRGLFDELGIDAATAFITNAVKHFKWEPRGKRRLHKTPAQAEFDACHVWLEKEIDTLQPKVIVALGANALVSLVGRRMTLTAGRESMLLRPDGTRIIATYHPSAVLRAPDSDRRQELRAILRDDLKLALKIAKKSS